MKEHPQWNKWFIEPDSTWLLLNFIRYACHSALEFKLGHEAITSVFVDIFGLWSILYGSNERLNKIICDFQKILIVAVVDSSVTHISVSVRVCELMVKAEFGKGGAVSGVVKVRTVSCLMAVAFAPLLLFDDYDGQEVELQGIISTLIF